MVSYNDATTAVIAEAGCIVRYLDRGDFDDVTNRELMTMLGDLKQAVNQYNQAIAAMMAPAYQKAA